ncbi:MAG: SRPBCC family protein [Miltoncostaeaceae bacterium]
MSVEATIVVPGERALVWARCSDLPRWPDWTPHCLAVEVDGPVAVGATVEFRMRHPRGTPFYTRPVITEIRPGEHMAWEARSLGLRAPVELTLGDEHDGTRATVRTDALGSLAMTYKMTLSEKAQARLWAGVLEALRESVAEGSPA